MQLLEGWQERIAAATVAAAETAPLPQAPAFYAGAVTFVETAEAAVKMVEFARQRPISHIGIDTEFSYTRPPVDLSRGMKAYDPRSIAPLLLSVSLAEPCDGGYHAYTFVVDLRVDGLVPALQELMRLPGPFVGHYLKVEYFCLWQLGVTEPNQTWDTWAAERSLGLGTTHPGYRLPENADDIDATKAKEEAAEDDEFTMRLTALCRRYGVPYEMASEKELLQRSFLEMNRNERFSEAQIRYAAEDAKAAAGIYPRQVLRAVCAGANHRLESIEMPWVRTNARIEWNGLRLDSVRVRAVREARERHLKVLEGRLEQEYGIKNFRSHPQLCRFFEGLGLLSIFRKNGTYSFDRKNLKLFRDRHPAISLLYAARRIYDLDKTGMLDLRLIGADGRVHPQHRQLGTHTGRQTTTAPNLLGLPKALRPLCIHDPENGVGEVDLSQIEVGVAAAVYGDAVLIAMFNSGDVYSEMAKVFYRDLIPPADLALPVKEFKRKYAHLRDRMKVFTLGIMYGMTPFGIAALNGISVLEARQQWARFLSMFPTLKKALRDGAGLYGFRGFSVTVSGLRRYRASSGALSKWERNWLVNHPVQGSAADVFKLAGNRLDRLYQQFGARIVLPFHDAFVFEAPLRHLHAVAELTAAEMKRAVQMYFPSLVPQAEINIESPECWNKDGDAGSVDRWLLDPFAEAGEKAGDCFGESSNTSNGGAREARTKIGKSKVSVCGGSMPAEGARCFSVVWT